jgi:hypothetical protein
MSALLRAIPRSQLPKSAELFVPHAFGTSEAAGTGHQTAHRGGIAVKGWHGPDLRPIGKERKKTSGAANPPRREISI